MQHIGRDANNVESLHFIGDTFHKVNRIGAQQNTQLVKGVEMLELHIDIRASHIVVEEVENGVVFLVHADIVAIII